MGRVFVLLAGGAGQALRVRVHRSLLFSSPCNPRLQNSNGVLLLLLIEENGLVSLAFVTLVASVCVCVCVCVCVLCVCAHRFPSLPSLCVPLLPFSSWSGLLKGES